MIPATAAGRLFRVRIALHPCMWFGSFNSTHPSLELALDLSANVTVGDLASPVATLLVSRQSQLHLRPRAFEIDPGRDQSQPFLRGFADQALNLLPMQQQFAR